MTGRDRPTHRGAQAGTGRTECRGIAASPGVGIGPAYVVQRKRVQVPKRPIPREDVQSEIGRFRAALRTTQEQLEAIKAKLPHGEHRQILKAQQMMLRDPDLTGEVEARIRDDLVNAEWAMEQVTQEVARALSQAGEDYFRERQGDVVHLSERVLHNLLGTDDREIAPPSGAVVVARDLSPADTAALARADVCGLVTELGSRTSHSAIMARSLEIPAVVGIERLMDRVTTGDMVVVDGVHGIVVFRPTEDEIETWLERRRRYDAFEDQVQREHALPATTTDGVHVALRANVALDEELASASFHGAEGVGLYRTEYLFMGREDLPTEDDHYRHAKAVLRRMAPHPVTFRTFDLGADKLPVPDVAVDEGPNPAMGVRSLRLALRMRGTFVAQLKGLLRAALHGPLRIMLPFVSGLEELEDAFAVVEEARRQLHEDGVPHAAEVPIGIMIETPSAALVADVLAPRVDFLSVGTNDLIQYTLAIDRENDDVGYLYEPLHPAILRLLAKVVRAAEAAGVSLSLCGEMAADPRYTWVLVGLGVRELSMHPSAVPVIKSIVRTSSLAEMRELADRVCAARSGREAEAWVAEVMGARFPEHLEHGGYDGVVLPAAPEPARGRAPGAPEADPREEGRGG